MAEAQNIHERTSAPSAQETSVRKKNAKQKLEISSVLLGRDRSVLSWWHEEKKMEATTHSTSYSLRSVRLSVCLSSLSLSLSLSLSPSLSDYWVRISSFLSGSCVWTLPWLLSWTENRENFLQLEKKNLSAAVGAHQPWRYRKELLLLQECDECLYLPPEGGLHAVRCVRCSQGIRA